WRSIGTDRRQAETPVDYPGAGLAIFSFLCLAWGLTNAEHAEGNTPLIWIAVGAIALVLFLWVEATRQHPMMPLSLFRSPVFSVANIYSFTLYSGLSIVFFYMPMALVGGWGLREIDASIAFAPIPVFMAVLSSRTGKLADRIGPAPLLVLGGLVSAVGYAWMALVAPSQAYFDGIIPAMCVVALGMALLVAPLSTAVMGSVDETQSGLASGINNAVSRLAGLMSVAATGGLVAASYATAGGTASFGEISDSPGHAAAVSTGLATAAWIAAGLCAVSAVAALGLLRRPQPRA
ncbi:MAG: MFS transporter, partial [Paracoccaceae bacterium]